MCVCVCVGGGGGGVGLGLLPSHVTEHDKKIIKKIKTPTK